MSESSIHFFSEEIDFNLSDEIDWIRWINHAIKQEKKELGYLNFIFCSDDFLWSMNKKYLSHDTLTDVISFPYSYQPVEGEIYISIDRVKENANALHISFLIELQRVIIHGVLHLLGYNDKTEEEVKLMRLKEEEFLRQAGNFKIER